MNISINEMVLNKNNLSVVPSFVTQGAKDLLEYKEKLEDRSPLDVLKEDIVKFDFYYSYSDDPKVYRSGKAKEEDLIKRAGLLIEDLAVRQRYVDAILLEKAHNDLVKHFKRIELPVVNKFDYFVFDQWNKGCDDEGWVEVKDYLELVGELIDEMSYLPHGLRRYVQTPSTNNKQMRLLFVKDPVEYTEYAGITVRSKMYRTVEKLAVYYSSLDMSEVEYLLSLASAYFDGVSLWMCYPSELENNVVEVIKDSGCQRIYLTV